MGALNNQELVDVTNKLFTADNAGEEGVLQRALGVIQSVELYSKAAADALASSTQALFPGLRLEKTVEITAAYFIPYAAVTADAANNAAILVQSNNGIGGAGTTIATLTTDLTQGNLVAGVTYTLTLSATFANRLISASAASALYAGVAINKNGTGVVVPAGKFLLTYVLR